jgi:hypothetical protein
MAITWAETSAATVKRQATKAVMTVPFEASFSKSQVPRRRAVEILWKNQNRSINVLVMTLFSICSQPVKAESGAAALPLPFSGSDRR